MARTIACLADVDETGERHVSEALQYRVPATSDTPVPLEARGANGARVA